MKTHSRRGEFIVMVALVFAIAFSVYSIAQKFNASADTAAYAK